MNKESNLQPQEAARQLQRILSTPEGKRLLALLRQDGGTALRQAAAACQAGDTQGAQRILQPMVQTPEAEELLKKLNEM